MTLVALLVTFLGISVLVALHEAGHWGVAEFFGFRVPIFQIGMGSPFYTIARIRKTDLRVSPWLIGGFCLIPEMFGKQIASEVMKAFDEPDFQGRDFPVYQRGAVAAAGPGMSFLAPFVAMFLLFAVYGVPVESSSVSQVPPAATGNPMVTAGTTSPAAATANDADFRQIQPKSVLMLPLMPVPKPSPAALQPRLQPEEILAAGTTSGITFRKVGLMQAAIASWRFNLYMTKMIAGGLADMFSNLNPFAAGRSTELRSHSTAAGASDMHGIVGIFQMAANAWNSGLYMFIVFLSILSLNWAVFNLLPIPMLDGGFLLFLGLEAVRGKPLNIQTEMAVRNIFLLLLLGLMLFGLYNDFAHPIR